MPHNAIRTGKLSPTAAQGQVCAFLGLQGGGERGWAGYLPLSGLPIGMPVCVCVGRALGGSVAIQTSELMRNAGVGVSQRASLTAQGEGGGRAAARLNVHCKAAGQAWLAAAAGILLLLDSAGLIG